MQSQFTHQNSTLVLNSEQLSPVYIHMWYYTISPSEWLFLMHIFTFYRNFPSFLALGSSRHGNQVLLTVHSWLHFVH